MVNSIVLYAACSVALVLLTVTKRYQLNGQPAKAGESHKRNNVGAVY